MQKYITAIALITMTAVALLGLSHTHLIKAGSDTEVYLPLIVNASNSSLPASPTPVPTLPPVDPATLRAQVIQAVNAERAKVGCASVVESVALDAATQEWNDYMLAHNYFDHSGTVDANWYLNHGYTATDWIMENLASGSDSGDQVVTLWMQDAGHRDTILQGCTDGGSTVEVGVGVSYHLWVMATGELHP